MTVITMELVFKSYMPKSLEKGMLFIRTTSEGNEIWELEKVPRQPIDEFIVENGAPVEPYIIYDEMDLMVEPEHIAWLDEGDDVDELRDLTVDDMNYILNEYNGEIDVQIDEELFDDDWEVAPILVENKVIVSIPGTYYEEENEEDYEDEEEN